MTEQERSTQPKPITERRLNRMRAVLERRQPDLTVVIENVHDPHNVSAVLRSCDAVGVSCVHFVYTHEHEPELSRVVSASAQKWLEIQRHASISDCYAVLRDGGFRILATALGEECLDLHEVDMTRPTAIVLGNEMRGCSEEAVEQADGTMLIPMMGMVQSLNISVACAVTLYEALRQRREANAYDSPRLSADVRRETLDFWLRRDRRGSLSDVDVKS